MSSTTLRPNATTSAPTSVTGAASAHAATSDDSDSSYFTVDDSNVPGVVGLGTTTLASGAITKQYRTRYRGRNTSADPNDLFAVEIITKSTATLGTQSVTVDETVTTYTGGYVPVTLTQAQIDDLNLTVSSPDSDSIRAYELYLDLVYVTQPSTTVTAVSPDPYTASTLVPIAWTNTLDSDGGPATRYEIKVFTDAQYGTGGFDPDTSTPYYTTGEVVSSALTANVGPLENGDTYRAYVRVAQTVNGASHWSDWAYDEFTMNVTTSDVDTVTAAADNGNGAIDVTVAWDSASTGWEYMEVQRSIDGGATWADVRGATYVATTDSGATDFTVTDYEVPNGTSVLYRARATYLSSSLQITGAWVQSSSVSWTSTDTFLKDPNDPSLNMVVKLTSAPLESYPVRQGVFTPLGAVHPVVISDTRNEATGTVGFWVNTITDVADLKSLLAKPVLLLHAPSTDDFGFEYFAPGRVDRGRVPAPLRRKERWTVEYVEVDAPADPDAGR